MEQIFFGKRIAELRRASGLSQEALARQLGVTNQAVSKWESDLCCPDIMQLPQIADFFGITMDSLFGRTPMPTSNGLRWENDNTLRAVCFLGRRMVEEKELPQRLKSQDAVRLCFTGNVDSVQSQFSVECHDCVISGDVKAGSHVTCGDVGGDVKAGNHVTCGNVVGNVKAGNNVTCGNIQGDAKAFCNINCGTVQGSVKFPFGKKPGSADGNEE